MDFLLDNLNDEQRRAVAHEEGPLLVIAGAGSGKTRVLTRRIAWLLHHGVPEWAILGVTFTNKAAREMQSRVQDLIPDSRIRLSTFHSACASWLRRSGEKLGFTRDFTIYDTQDRDQLIKQLMRERDLPVKELRPSRVGHRISSLKNQGLTPDIWEPDELDPMERYVHRLYGPYQEALASMNAMDFDDLLLHFLKLIETDEEERERYARRFRHVLVDEFQDTNSIQYRIVRGLSDVHRNLCVVGDPDQSIYSFRGAEIGNILSFPKDYDDATVVKLETNYRSSATILDFAQRVIDNNAQRFDKRLVAAKEGGEDVAYIVTEDGRAEARDVAYQVRALLQRGVAADEIAVFYRARFLSRSLEEAFRASNVPYELVGDVGFFGRKEIKDLIAFLQVAVNPRDSVSLARILNVPPRGIGRVSQDRFVAAAAERGVEPGELLLHGKEALPKLSGKAATGLAQLGALFVEAQLLAGDSVERTLELILERTGYLEAVCRTGSYQDVDREENVQELLVGARRFDEQLTSDRGERQHAVSSYLQEVSLFQDASERERAPGSGASVQMMTVHAAKGLEFDHVFVVGLEERVFPHRNSEDSRDALEEERRLFYVAATRARETLTLLRARYRDSYGQGPQANLPSRFLREGGVELSASRRRDGFARRGDMSDDDHAEYDDGEPVYEVDRSGRDAPGELASKEYRAGERVIHPTYGDGKILNAYGSGANTKVEVLFASGVRTLLVEYARLERYDSA